MTISEPLELGLRERKRLATRRAIELAALDLVGKHGLSGVTIDEISRVADVSPRTFFNYFPSKEEAVLGDPPKRPSDDAVAAFVGGGSGDLFADLSDLLIGAWSEASVDMDVTTTRQRVIKQYPELFGLRLFTMRAFENDLTDIVEARVAHDRPDLADDPAARQRMARFATLVGVAAMRSAWHSWIQEPASAQEDALAALPARIHASFDDLRALLQH
jgi:AcrR family transcriptional regulator